jgi:hypothetical protein
MNLGVNFDLIEKLLILERAVEIAFQKGAKFNDLLEIIVKRYP